MPLFSSRPPFIWSANADGLAVRFSDVRVYKKAREGRAEPADQLAFIRMQMLTECGQAEVRDVDSGIFIATADAVRLDAETRDGFSLPPCWPGGMRLLTESVPQLQAFRPCLGLVDSGASVHWDWRLRGPLLEIGQEAYLPTVAQYAALRAYADYQQLEIPDEFSNLSLLATLRDAWEQGCHIELEAYRQIIIGHASELEIDAREDSETGDVILRPVAKGSFETLDASRIEERLSQLQAGSERAVLRVGKTIVLMNPEQTAQARAVANRGRIPKAQRKEFEKNPSAWLAENVFPDITAEFSPRVTGVGTWGGGYLGANWEEGENWFGKQPETEKRDDKKTTAPATESEPDPDDIEPDDKLPEPVVPLIIPNDTELGFGWRFPALSGESGEPFVPDLARFARPPFPHQKDAVRWLLGHARRALTQGKNGASHATAYGAGALLADDMGLGKTFSTLIFMAEWFGLWRKKTGTEPPAALIVAPLSLLENWKAEIEKSFWPDQHVFTRVIIAQPDGDLAKVRRSPGSRDIAVPGEVRQYGLGFGDGTERSVDYPGSCVLTTYQTLRDYRFSFAKAEWSAAIFDEAQNIKNPNAMQTIAAKALKALFRLTLTGTPVENHLGDFWSIIDTAEPGPLGSFHEFKQKWILRMAQDRSQMAEIGQELRQQVGNLMLRRTKEEELTGLPLKSGGAEPVLIDMTSEQAALYNSIIDAAQDAIDQGHEGRMPRQNRQLAALWHLRQISLHPDLLGNGSIRLAKTPDAARSVLNRSGKLAWLLECLDQIKKRGKDGEKGIIFCVQKKLQEALAHNLGVIYGLTVPVINGDTKATSRRNPDSTRLGLIEQFSNQPGFGICVLSPIAAGAGLNIVAANHVIHLERHWNPAKEDQATDRVYRIGQTRPVTVYLPTARHPEIESFDIVLHRLLDKKRSLQSALGLVPPEAVSGPELMNEIFGRADGKRRKTEIIDLQAALKLSWRLFEALIATLYQSEAERVILTPGGTDRGCDVVVLGWGRERANLLIQCKSTQNDKLDSEFAVREIEGARPFYEKALGVVFSQRYLHTTAKNVSRRTSHAAAICGITVHKRQWLADKLLQTPIPLSSVLDTDMKRERVA